VLQAGLIFCSCLVTLRLVLDIFGVFIYLGAKNREGLEGSLAKFGCSDCFERFANVPDSEGTVRVGLSFQNLFYFFFFFSLLN
jgi:hypothetical protein